MTSGFLDGFKGQSGRVIFSSLFIGCLLVGGLLFGPPAVNALSPNGFDTTYKAGVAAYREGNFESALESLHQAERLSPGHVNTQYYLAIVLDKLARGAEAAKYYALVSQYGTEQTITDYSRKRLASLRITYNLPNEALQLPLRGVQDEPDSTVAVAIPLMNQQSALMVNAELNQKVRGTFIVDTGATYTSISQEMANQLGPDNLKTIGQVRITTANGQIEVPKVLIREININGLRAYNVEATIINLNKSGKFSGLLGLSFIRHFQLTIDPVANQLVFKRV